VDWSLLECWPPFLVTRKGASGARRAANSRTVGRGPDHCRGPTPCGRRVTSRRGRPAAEQFEAPPEHLGRGLLAGGAQRPYASEKVTVVELHRSTLYSTPCSPCCPITLIRGRHKDVRKHDGRAICQIEIPRVGGRWECRGSQGQGEHRGSDQKASEKTGHGWSFLQTSFEMPQPSGFAPADRAVPAHRPTTTPRLVPRACACWNTETARLAGPAAPPHLATRRQASRALTCRCALLC
jgi:hypothetical protein